MIHINICTVIVKWLAVQCNDTSAISHQSYCNKALWCPLFVCNWEGNKPRGTPDKEVRLNPLVLAWVTNVLTNPNLYIEFSKVHIFWEGHKILWNLPLTFDYSTYSQKLGEDFAKFCCLLRLYELYKVQAASAYTVL